jgi:hypothetical protein
MNFGDMLDHQLGLLGWDDPAKWALHRRFQVHDTLTALAAGTTDHWARWQIICGQLAAFLQDLPGTQQASVFQSDIIHERKQLFHPVGICRPPIGPRRHGSRFGNREPKVSQALFQG